MTTGTHAGQPYRCTASNRHKRITKRTRRVLELLARQDHPQTAQQLYAKLVQADVPIGLVTVYRALHTLTDAGLVHEFHRVDEAVFRVCTPTEHAHLICAHCGRIEEQQAPGLDGTLTEAARTGFRVTSSRVEIYGLCDRCAPPPIPSARVDPV